VCRRGERVVRVVDAKLLRTTRQHLVYELIIVKSDA